MDDEELLNQLTKDIYNIDLRLDKRIDNLEKKLEIGFNGLNKKFDEKMKKIFIELGKIDEKLTSTINSIHK